MRRLLPVLIAMTWLAEGRAAAGADLVCVEPLVDKGLVRSGSPLAQRFTLVNRGREAVEITEVKPSCGCLVPRLEKRLLQAGEQGVLDLAINTLTSATGLQNWRVQVFYTCASRSEELNLQLRANVVPEITVEPAALVVFTSGPLQRTIYLIERRPQPLALAGLRTTSPYLRVQAGAAGRDDAGHWTRSITLDVLPDFPEGRHEETLAIIPADPAFGEWHVPITVVKRVRNSVSFTPETLTFTGPVGQALPARLLRLRGQEDQPVVVERVEATDPALRCDWAQGPGQQVTLKVSVDTAKAPHGLQAEVRCYLRQPTLQMVSIPVTWIVK